MKALGMYIAQIISAANQLHFFLFFKLAITTSIKTIIPKVRINRKYVQNENIMSSIKKWSKNRKIGKTNIPMSRYKTELILRDIVVALIECIIIS